MNNLLSVLLAAGEANDGNTEIWDLVIQYAVFAAIIVISIILLVVLHKQSRLPRHGELKKKLSSLLDEINEISSAEKKRMDFIKKVSRVIYTADNLAYVATMLAEKERYADLGKIAALISEARAELAPYKLGKKEAAEPDGINLAAEKVSEAIAVLDDVIERDNALKRK